MNDRLSKQLKHWAKSGLGSLGLKVTRLRHLPAGIDLCLDLRRCVPRGRIRAIFDVGANVGQTAEMFARSFPAARIVSFEPVEGTFHQLVSNTSRFPNVRCVRSALGAATGTQRLYHQADSQWNSLVGEVNRENGNRSFEDISVMTIDDFCLRQGIERIDLLKTDTEGFDLEVLRGALQMLDAGRCLFVYSEVTFCETDERHSNFSRVREFLKDRGFCFVALYEQNIRGDLMGPGYSNALFANPRAL